MADDELDLEEAWQDVRPTHLIQVVKKDPLDLKTALDVAAEKALFKLKPEFDKHSGENFTSELMSQLITKGVRTFLDCWFDELKSYDLAGLVEIILEGQNMTTDELQDFVRAIPQSLLERICASSIGATATGVHALMGVENARRTGRLGPDDYTLKRDLDGVLKVSFLDREGQRIEVRLDEHFDVSSEWPYDHG